MLHVAATVGDLHTLQNASRWMLEEAKDDLTLTQRAAIHGQIEILKLLKQKGVCLDRWDSEGNTALMLLIGADLSPSKKWQTAKWLIDQQGNLEVCNELQETPLLFAVMHEEYTIANYLLDAKAQVNVETLGGWTPLTLALANKHPPDYLITRLLEAKADIHCSLSEYTPLTVAIAYRHHSWVSTLYDKGVNINGTAFASPLLVALQMGVLYKDVTSAQFLLKHGCSPLRRSFAKKLPRYDVVQNFAPCLNPILDALYRPLILSSSRSMCSDVLNLIADYTVPTFEEWITAELD